MLAAPEIVIRFAFSDGTKSFGVALSNLGVAPKVGVAPEVGEKAPLCTPLCTPLISFNINLFGTHILICFLELELISNY